MNPRRQGDLGEFSAVEWFGSQGIPVFYPLGHSPDADLVVALDDRLARVQVKTTSQLRGERWECMLCTRGGNQSWNRVAKVFSAQRCDLLFVHVADGRRWLIPSEHVEGATGIALGGPKYAAYEIDPGRPFAGREAA